MFDRPLAKTIYTCNKNKFENNFPFVPQCNAANKSTLRPEKDENRESQQNALSK